MLILKRLRTPTPWLVLGFFVSVALLHQWVKGIGGPEVIDERYGLAAPAAMVVIQTLLSAGPFPSELWALASSGMYGWLAGTVMTWAGWTMGSMIQYALARRGAKDFGRAEGEPESAVEAQLARLPAWLRRLPLTHPVFLVAVRWFPMGFHFANVAAGARRVPVGRQLVIAAIGSVPGAAIWAAIGAGAATGLSWS